MKFKKVNMQMKPGVWVQVMNPQDPNYLEVGEIIKMEGTTATVKFSRFKRKKYQAMYLQTLSK